MTDQSKWKAVILSVSFLLIICFPIVNKKLDFFQEQRNPDFNYSEEPEFDLNHLDAYPGQYEKYFNENIGFTSHALDLNAIFKLNFLEVSPNQAKVLVGQNNWLFMTGKPLNDFRGINLLSPEEVKQLVKILHGRAVRMKERGSTFYFAIAPNKHRMYAEYMPANITQAEGTTVFDQVVDALRTDTLIHLIDLRAPLQQAKSQHVLYYKKDNHWNDIGAFIGYKTIIQKISERFPQVVPVSFDDYTIDTTRNLVGGDALQIGVDNLIRETRVMLTPKFQILARTGVEQNYIAPEEFAYKEDFEIVREVKNENFPTAVIIRDSFTDFMLDFFSENFRKSTFIFDNWEYKENENIIETENPDIVLVILVEQNIRRIAECDNK